ncbi:MAG: GNAT family N-acetyltransferase [Bdellovibrionaceae bacterium]|nr:GNAT family N-acetyltransferase [Pseudobdellovibrionaceae bacterium]
MEKKFVVAREPQDLIKFFPVMKELRPHLEMESYLSIYQEAHRNDGYEIVAIEANGQVQAVMGYRLIADYVRGRHVYIDDLVVSETVRSKGLGGELLKYAEGVAKENNCDTLRLCTGIENDRGVKFYEKSGWTKRAFAYTKKITISSKKS